ncbi:hypothetical protein BC332_27650 [Capsicum chinense]|nr:hypothetical protein BC332_27650 [Capsicum chinense]
MVQDGDHSNSTTPFGAVHGKPFFEYSVDEPRFNRLFNEAMSCDAPLVTSVITEYCKGAFEGLKSLVDIGGGTGTLAKAIVDTFPQISCTVFDLPQVIEGCEGSKNITYVSGDMFKFNPSVDVIFLKENAYETKLFMDVLMMVHPFGKERSQQEWTKLFSDSGFSVWLSSGLDRANPELARVI